MVCVASYPGGIHTLLSQRLKRIVTCLPMRYEGTLDCTGWPDRTLCSGLLNEHTCKQCSSRQLGCRGGTEQQIHCQVLLVCRLNHKPNYVQDAHMSVYALHARCRPGQSEGAVARLQHIRQGTDEGMLPALSLAESQKRQSNKGAGADCSGKQHLSDHWNGRSSSQKESRSCSSDSHHNTCLSSRQKVRKTRDGQTISFTGKKRPQSESVHECSHSESESESQCDSKDERQSNSKSESESESSTENTDAEVSGSSDRPLGGKQGTAANAQQAAFKCLDAIFSTTGSEAASLKSRVGQASPPHRAHYRAASGEVKCYALLHSPTWSVQTCACSMRHKAGPAPETVQLYLYFTCQPAGISIP